MRFARLGRSRTCSARRRDARRVVTAFVAGRSQCPLMRAQAARSEEGR